ncbi:alpha/beta fold hydrolase [Paenibacillus sp. GCM10023252]|uniref:alpha/beta fold hydrolase n=1 Tax=Paenibacillus sp. GCM10023252 TaxID=3252649 RepID=UPI003612EE15
MNRQERTRSEMEIGYVFISGAGLGTGIWEGVVQRLNRPYLLIEPPIRRGLNDTQAELTLQEYVSDMKQQVVNWGLRKIILVAHSLGGVLALRLADELSEQLAGFVAVGAAIPKDGGSFLSTLPFPKRLIVSAIMRKMGTKPPESAIRTELCNDLTAEQAAAIVRDFVPESIRVYTDRTESAVPAADVPKLYVKLSKDKAFPPSQQDRMIKHLDPHEVTTIDAGHLPMISQPAELVQAITNLNHHE